MNFLSYLGFRLALLLFKILPFRAVYWISDFLRFILQDIVKYRSETVSTNIRNSFPELDNASHKDIIDGFYKNLADIFVEGLKGLVTPEKILKRRYIWLNTELSDRYFREGKHVIGIGGHLGNWEWGALTVHMYLQHRIIGLVKPIKNKYIDTYVQKNRGNPQVKILSIKNTRTGMAEYQDQPSLFMMVSDQSPSNMEKAYWTDFLNQHTPCLHGADDIARLNNWPVISYLIRRTSRGYYEVESKILAEDSGSKSPGEIVSLFMNDLEAHIRKYPSDWLWSHRRWKRASHEAHSNQPA